MEWRTEKENVAPYFAQWGAKTKPYQTNPDGSRINNFRGDIQLFSPVLIDTPLSRISEMWGVGFQFTNCADFELDYAKCASRVGSLNAKEACKEFYEDMMECAYKYKQSKRVKMMRQYRREQGLPLPEKPAPDTIQQNI